MEENLYLMAINRRRENEIAKIRECNSYTSKYGLVLTEAEIKEISVKRTEALFETQRLELGEWIVDKIIKEFCDSIYIEQSNYAETICELIDIFYYFKNETKELVTDDDLIKFMKKHFENEAEGSLEYLKGTILERMTDNVLNGKPMEDMGEEDGE